ncbi:MAG: GTP-binding protein [Gemmatimonadetes bacterium]|nr:GTP-binding protein [Gemmatimonadota bacterium]
MAVPLLLIVGYLGAGKTTLLQRVIPLLGAEGVRPRVILNDYQDARVDAARLAALDALVTPISGDCICCGSREELLESLAGLVIDADTAVLIEANGTSDAAELHDVLALDPRLSALSRPIQVTVIDARRWQKRWFDKTLEREQVTTASHVWMNWAEELAPRRLASVEASLVEVNPLARRTTPEALTIELSSLVRQPTPTRIVRAGASSPSAHHDPHRHHFASVGVELPAVVERSALTSRVLALGPGLRRAKGVIGLADAPGAQWAWSYVAGDDALRFEALPLAGFATVAVFIGINLDEAALTALVEALRSDATAVRVTP